MPPLSAARAEVIEALLNVYPRGLRKGQLWPRSGWKSARRLLRALVKDSEEGRSAIVFPGQSGRGMGYRIADW